VTARFASGKTASTKPVLSSKSIPETPELSLLETIDVEARILEVEGLEEMRKAGHEGAVRLNVTGW
jgi:hypothetical protein